MNYGKIEDRFFINVKLCSFHYFQTERSMEHIIYIVEG